MASSSPAPSFAVVLVRITVGLLLLHEARELWLRDVGPWIVEDTAFRMTSAPGWYQRFGDLVYRFPELFSWAVVLGAALAGAAFVLGAAVRPASLGVVFLMLNAILAGPGSKREYAALTAACALACFVAHAGQRFGLDPHLPRWISWSAGKASKAARS